MTTSGITDLTAPERADTTDFLAIHTCLRRAGRALAESVAGHDPRDRARGQSLQRYWQGYAGEILAHHTVEDDIFYPALVERAPVAAEHLGRIDADHHTLDELMAEGHIAMTHLAAGGPAGPAAYVLRHLDHVMRVHLDYEDAEVVPLFPRHFDEQEYRALGKAAGRSISFKQALFTVPFVGSWVDDGVRDELLGGAPLPFRVLYRLTRSGHERLAAAALGDARHGAGERSLQAA
jgi:hemerythrin-like domain-containing protein